MPKARIKQNKPCTVSVQAPGTNKELVTVDITWTEVPPDAGKLAVGPLGSATYRATAPGLHETMRLRIRIVAGDKAQVEVTSDGKTITDEKVTGTAVWGYITES